MNHTAETYTAEVINFPILVCLIGTKTHDRLIMRCCIKMHNYKTETLLDRLHSNFRANAHIFN
jgi:hypothetical protein